MSLTRSRGGFTLVEMLVVVVIIGVMVVGGVLALGVTGRDRGVENESRRLFTLLGYASEEAELQTRDYGLRVTRDGYTFMVFDARTGVWAQITADVLRPRKLPGGLYIELAVEGRKVVLPADGTRVGNKPDIAVTADGELSPFELAIRRDGTRVRQAVSTDKDGKLVLGELGEDTGA
jgi:general secretion pathway protein H